MRNAWHRRREANQIEQINLADGVKIGAHRSAEFFCIATVTIGKDCTLEHVKRHMRHFRRDVHDRSALAAPAQCGVQFLV
jgi:hypothetical protein